MRTNSCRLVRDFDAGLRRWIDRNTGEEIKTEALLPEDHQLDLELVQEENAKREADAESEAWDAVAQKLKGWFEQLGIDDAERKAIFEAEFGKPGVAALSIEELQQLVGAYEEKYGESDPDLTATDEQHEELTDLIKTRHLDLYRVKRAFRAKYDEELEDATVGQVTEFIAFLKEESKVIEDVSEAA